MKYQNDIDKMNTNRNLFLMSLPIFVELLLQLLVGNVDQMMVSRVSQPSVAAIVNANQIMNLVIIVLSMASTAVTVILSQYLGAQDEKNASRTCMVSLVLIGGVSLAATDRKRQRFWFLPGTRRFTGRSMCRRRFLMRRRCIC